MGDVILVLIIGVWVSVIIGAIYLLIMSLFSGSKSKHNGNRPTVDMYYHPTKPNYEGMWKDAIDRLKFSYEHKSPEQVVADLQWSKFWNGNYA